MRHESLRALGQRREIEWRRARRRLGEELGREDALQLHVEGEQAARQADHDQEGGHREPDITMQEDANFSQRSASPSCCELPRRRINIWR